MTDVLLWPEAEALLDGMAELLQTHGIDPGDAVEQFKNVAPLGDDRSDPVRPLDDLGRAAIRLVLTSLPTLLPWPEVGPAHLHVAAANWIATLARMAALTLPVPSLCHPQDGWYADVTLQPGEHDPAWRPDRWTLLPLTRRLSEYVEETGFVDAVAVAGALADLHDAARAYAAEVELIDGLHGIRFERDLLVIVDNNES